MTIGQKLKKLRSEKGITQKDLADQLRVTFQTISKWEKDENEPDLATISRLAKFYNVSTDYLLNDDEQNDTEKSIETTTVPTKIQMGICLDCGKPIYHGDETHQLERATGAGVKEIVTICGDCFKKHEALNKEKEKLSKPAPKKVYTGPFHKITNRNDSKPLIWSIVIGVLAMIIALVVCIVNYNNVGIGWTIGAPIIIGYALTATIYCIFTASYISDVFMGIASWSIKFPGLIFTWDLDGFMWLIAMKILFAVLGVLVGIGVFLLALSLSAFLSVFSFIPLLIYNKTHY